MKRKITIITILAITALISIFSLSYYFSKTNLFKEKSKDVDKSTFSSGLELSEDTSIVTKSKDDKTGEYINYKAMKYKDFIKQFNYTGKADRESLEKFMTEKNYKLESKSDKELIFIKSSEKALLKNKFYLGVTEEGYICIYKCNDEGKLFIEDKKQDISKRRIDDLQDYEKNKVKNHEFMFNTKEEALDALSEYDS